MNSQLKFNRNWLELAKEASWSVAKLARSCGVSSRTLERHFLKEMGQSPKAWLMEHRRRLADKLRKDGLSVKQMAANLDYKHSTHLSRDYKEYFGCCPTDKKASTRVQNH